MGVSGFGKRFRLLVAISLVLAMVSGPAAVAGPPESAGSGRYIVVLRDGVSPHPAAEALGRVHGLVPVHVYEHALNGFAAVVPPARLAALSADPRVAYIEPDLVMSIAAESVPTGVARIGAEYNPAFPSPGGSVNVNVAIIDTGIDLDHSDLNVLGNVTFVARTSTGDDDHGHGTHVAGTVAAKYNGSGVVGVAPGAGLYAVKVLNRQGSGYLTDIIKGIDWVTANSDKIAVANMSIGGTGVSASYRAAIANSVAAGVVYVVAAGNAGRDVYGTDGVFGTSDDYIPAAYPEVAAVSALADSDGKAGGTGMDTSYGPDDTLATFSNYSRSVVVGNPVASSGKAIDVAAPGVSIYSTYKNGGYTSMSGTSMASPHVAGVAALYIAQHSRASNAAGVYAIRQAIIDAGQEQSLWRTDGDTRDPDGNKEPMALAGLADPPTPAPGVALSPLAQEGTALVGETATYMFTVKNTGTATGTYSATVTWTADATLTKTQLVAGESTTVTVVHTVPAGTPIGTVLTETLTVTEAGGATATATFSTTAVSSPPQPAGLVVQITLGGSPKPGDNVQVVVTVTDADGSTVSGANVSLEFATQGRTYTPSGTTNDRGTYQVRIKTQKTDAQPWTITANASKDGALGTATLVYPSQ